jgi:hypothetical protein
MTHVGRPFELDSDKSRSASTGATRLVRLCAILILAFGALSSDAVMAQASTLTAQAPVTKPSGNQATGTSATPQSNIKPGDPSSLPPMKPLASLTGQSDFTRNERKILQAIERCAALHSVIGASLQDSGEMQTGQENAEYGAYLAGVAIERRLETAQLKPTAPRDNQNAALAKARSETIAQVQAVIRHYMVEMSRSTATTEDGIPKIVQADLEICNALPKVVSVTPASLQKPK